MSAANLAAGQGWTDAVTAGLGAVGAAAGGGPSSAKADLRNSLNPIVGSDFNVNFGGKQDVNQNRTGTPQELTGLGGINYASLIVPVVLVVGAIMAIKAWKKSK